MFKNNLNDIFSDLDSESSLIMPKSIKIKNIKSIDTISDATSSFMPQKGRYSDATSSFMPQKGGYSDATSSFMPQKGGYLNSYNNDINQYPCDSATSESNYTTNSTDTEKLKNALFNLLDGVGGGPKRYVPLLKINNMTTQQPVSKRTDQQPPDSKRTVQHRPVSKRTDQHPVSQRTIYSRPDDAPHIVPTAARDAARKAFLNHPREIAMRAVEQINQKRRFEEQQHLRMVDEIKECLLRIKKQKIEDSENTLFFNVKEDLEIVLFTLGKIMDNYKKDKINKDKDPKKYQKMVNNFIIFGVGNFGKHDIDVNSFVKFNDRIDKYLNPNDKNDEIINIRETILKIRKEEKESNTKKGIKYMRFAWDNNYKEDFNTILQSSEWLTEKYREISEEGPVGYSYDLKYATLFEFYNIFSIFHRKYPFFYDITKPENGIVQYLFYSKRFEDIRIIINEPFLFPSSGIKTTPSNYIWDGVDKDIIYDIQYCIKRIIQEYYKAIELELIIEPKMQIPVYFNVGEDLKILYMCLSMIVINNFFYYFYAKEENIVKSMKDDDPNLYYFHLPKEIFKDEKYKGIEHYIRNFQRFGVLLRDDVYNPDNDPLIKFKSGAAYQAGDAYQAGGTFLIPRDKMHFDPPGINREELEKYENDIKRQIKEINLEEAKTHTFNSFIDPFIWDYSYKEWFDRINKGVNDLYNRSIHLYNLRFTETNRYRELHYKIFDIYDVFTVLIGKYPNYYNEKNEIERFSYDKK